MKKAMLCVMNEPVFGLEMTTGELDLSLVPTSRTTKSDVVSLRINSEAPNFTAETTQGKISFHDWIGDG